MGLFFKLLLIDLEKSLYQRLTQEAIKVSVKMLTILQEILTHDECILFAPYIERSTCIDELLAECEDPQINRIVAKVKNHPGVEEIIKELKIILGQAGRIVVRDPRMFN